MERGQTLPRHVLFIFRQEVARVIMNKRKVTVIAVGLICMSIILYMASEIINSWETTSAMRKIVKFFAMLGWCYITYNVITLKYKWLKRLTDKKQ